MARQPSSHRNRGTTTAAASSVTKEELEANLQRWEESGKKGDSHEWQWTLNWNEIDDKILVGSCPRSTQDVVELKRVAEVDAILCLQSDGCFEALNIDYGDLREKGAQLGVVMSRVAIWDFNHNDQALMIPEAIRKLALLLAMGKRVYVHCTAGINRATLTVVGYLTFVKGWSLDDAVREVKGKRPQAHPYLDCWHTMRTRFTEGRTPELLQIASRLYEQRKAAGRENEGDSVGDWVRAENALITESYQRQIQADLSIMMSLGEVDAARATNNVCLTKQEYNNMQAEMGLLRDKAEKDRAKARAALADAAQVSDENKRLREANPDAVALLESSERKARLKIAEREINSLKGAIRQVAFAAITANSGSDDERMRSSGALDPKNASADITTLVPAPFAVPEGPSGTGPVQNGVKAGGSKVSDSAVKDRKQTDRSSARAHNGAHPSNEMIARGNSSSTPGGRWPLGATWPFRNIKHGTDSSGNRESSKVSSSSSSISATEATPEATEQGGSPSTPLESTSSATQDAAKSSSDATGEKKRTEGGEDYSI